MSLITAKAVSLLMTSNKALCTLQFAYELQTFEQNFETLRTLVHQSPDESIILAPELCLSGYRYDTMREAASFSCQILPKLCELSTCKTLGLTLITQQDEKFFNTFMLFHKGACIYTQHKAKLFALGDEETYFCAGSTDAIHTFSVDGIKIAVLICFELRFPALWEQIKGADIIMVPSFWGYPRKGHLEALTTALAIANQAYVMCANSADEGMACSSGIVSPFGEVYRNDKANLIMHPYDSKEVQKMRRYIDIGLNHHASHGSL